MQHWPAIVLSVLLYCFGTSTSALAADPPPIEVNTNNAAKQKTEALAKKLEDSAAVQTYQQALRLKPDYAGPRFGLATILQQQGNEAAAVQQYRTLVRSGDDEHLQQMARQILRALGAEL